MGDFIQLDINGKTKKISIVFIGTSEFAVASLDALIKAGFPIVGVITSPDKPAGRGMKLNESIVKKYAAEKEIKILQPEKLKNEFFLGELRSLNADLQIVVAFRMLPEAVWNMPPMGTINLHASLLPQYRGAAPINWAIINGEKETGVTTFKLRHEIDTGNILLEQRIKISDEETAGELHDKMKLIGADLLVKTVKGLADGSLGEITQESLIHSQGQNPASPLHLAPKIFTETCQIDWNKTVDEVYNLIRGLSPYPTAFTYLDEKMFKVYRAEKDKNPVANGGRYITDGKKYLKFPCLDGYISVKEIQMEGKKKMMVEEFLRGWRN
ncbi:MAG TPA: methionyl-tRNA formyltransferase [Puia sp.]|nr:methionyl-tRNA formyltransferase [Puia sp.]